MTTITIERATVEKWKAKVNTLAATTQKADRYRIGAELKQSMFDSLAAPATAPDELERLRQIAHLTGTIFCYGNFVAETHNEAVLEKLLRENGTFWDSVEQYEKSQGWIP